MNELSIKDNELIPPSNELIPYKDKQITQLGNLYIERINDTLHRVRKYKINFIGGTSKQITYEQYEKILDVITRVDAPKFLKFKSGDIVAVSQIASIKTEDVVVDTRREDM